jgi:hypothetical protein
VCHSKPSPKKADEFKLECKEKFQEWATALANSERFSTISSLVSSNGGADGIRTHDLLDAIEARSQLRHGPTGIRLS